MPSTECSAPNSLTTVPASTNSRYLRNLDRFFREKKNCLNWKRESTRGRVADLKIGRYRELREINPLRGRLHRRSSCRVRGEPPRRRARRNGWLWKGRGCASRERRCRTPHPYSRRRK